MELKPYDLLPRISLFWLIVSSCGGFFFERLLLEDLGSGRIDQRMVKSVYGFPPTRLIYYLHDLSPSVFFFVLSSQVVI